MKKLVLLLALCAATLFATAQIRYVTPTGTGNGTSWTNASGDLQAMIDDLDINFGSGQVWVAQGVYFPNNPDLGHHFGPHDTYVTSQNSFILHNEIEVYGGFEGGESSIDQRDWKNNTTILSGDSSFHTVIIAGVNNAVLNGFTIKGGTADRWMCDDDCIPEYNPYPYWDECPPRFWMMVHGIKVSDHLGGGIAVVSANSITLKNLIVSENEAYRGGGINFHNSTSCLVQNVTLNYNSAYGGGGGISIEANSDAQLVNVLIHENVGEESSNCNSPSQQNGGGVYVEASYPEFINSTIADNIASLGADIYNVASSVTFTNSIINEKMYINVDHANVVNFQYYLISNNSLIADIPIISTTPHTVYPSISLNNSLIGNIPSGSNVSLSTSNNGTTIGGSVSPNFVLGSYLLSTNSPCIDAGNQNFVNSYTQIDLAGNYRVAGKNVDMGAFEFGSNPAPPAIVNAKNMLWNDDNVLQEAITENMNLTVYPNPVLNGQQTSVYLGGNLYYEKAVDLKLYSIDGKLLYSKVYSNGNIQTHLPDLSSGMYMLNVQTQDGEIYNQKLFIHK